MTARSNKTLLSSIFSYTTALVISQVLVAIYTLLLIFWLSTEAYGVIAANYAAVLLTSFLINLGLHEWLIRTIPNRENSSSITGGILGYKVIVGILWGSGLMVFLPIIKPEIYEPGLLIIIILDTWFESSLYLLLADLLGNGKVTKTSILLIASRVLRLASIIIIIFLGLQNAIPVVFVRLLSTILIFTITLLIAKPVIKGQNLIHIFRILRSSIVFNAAEIQNLIFLQIDLNLFALLSDNETLIGQFAIAISLLNMIMSFPLGISSMLLPSTIKIRKSSKKQFRQRIMCSFLGFFIFGAVLWAGVQIFQIQKFQNFFPNNYQSAFSILLIASPLLFIRTINQANRVYLLSVEKERKQLVPQFSAILFKLVVGIFITIEFGLEGLIWLSIISDLLLLLGFTYQVLYHLIQSTKKTIP